MCTDGPAEIIILLIEVVESAYGTSLQHMRNFYRAYHKSYDSPASLEHHLGVTVHGVHQVQRRCHRAVVRSDAASKNPEVVTMQMEGVLLGAVACS